jgi:hypothetical protein
VRSGGFKASNEVRDCTIYELKYITMNESLIMVDGLTGVNETEACSQLFVWEVVIVVYLLLV